MANTPSERFEVPSIVLDTWKLRNPSFVPLLPAEFMPVTGRVAVMWGHFETIFEGLLIALAKAEGLAEADWRSANFRKKRALLRELWETHLLPICPRVTQELDAIFPDIEPLYVRRNLAVHGQMSTAFDVEDGRGVARLICVGRHRGREIRESFSSDQLDDLFYAVAHLAGRLARIAQGNPLSVRPPSPEILFLRDFLETKHPTYPNVAMPLPPSSRG